MTAAWNRFEGAFTESGPTGVVRTGTFTCVHCSRLQAVSVEEKKDVGWCRKCMGPTCNGCAGKKCVPYERRMERAEARAAALRSYEECK